MLVLSEEWRNPHSVKNELLRLEEWMDENDELLDMLRADEKRMSEKGPYAEYKSAPEAVRAYLSQKRSVAGRHDCGAASTGIPDIIC